MHDYTMGEMDRNEYAPEMMHDVCPECNGTGWSVQPNSPQHPCSRCASEWLRGIMHEGIKDTIYKSPALLKPEKL